VSKERTTSCSHHACVMQKILFCLRLFFCMVPLPNTSLAALDITDTSDIDESVSGLSCDSDVSFIEDICSASLALSSRENKLFVARMNWHRHFQSLLHEKKFYDKYRMSLAAFNKLLDLLSPKLKLNAKFARMAGSEPISTEIMLHCTIRYLARGSYHDIHATAFISRPSFFHLVWHTIDVINSCNTLNIDLPRLHELDKLCSGFRQISMDGAMDGCIGDLDGYFMRITAPSHRECGNVSAYFSGHYCTYGVNVQAVSNAIVISTFIPTLLLAKLMITLQ